MKVLVLCKRFHTGKDLVADRFGRLFELPEAMAIAGHEVQGIAMAYRRARMPAAPVSDRVSWHVGDLSVGGLLDYRHALHQALRDWRPDVIWAGSDALQAGLGARLARREAIPLVIDLYDDYEAFGLTRLPGMRGLLRRACRGANALTVVSRTLARKVATAYGVTAPVHVLGNGVREDLFHPRDGAAARRQFGLPGDAHLIGAVGALTDDRGIDDLWRAFQHLAATDERLWLVLAGRRSSRSASWSHPRLRWLGELPLEAAAAAVSALDVAVVCNRDSLFGRACHPLKLVEAVAAGRPVVAAAVGDVGLLLAGRPDCLYPPGDWHTLAQRITGQLASPSPVRNLPAPSWTDVGADLARVLEDVVARSPLDGHR